MQKGQIISILGALGLFCVLYFGCDTKSKEQKDLVKTRSQNIERLNIERLVHEKETMLSVAAQQRLLALKDSLKAQEDPAHYKSMASIWYAEGQPLISGHYARKAAELIEDEEQAWAITGTTFAIASKQSVDDNEKAYAIEKSRLAYEAASSINPNNVDHKINLALSYVDMPEESNPMKGILMLVDLNKKHPDNVSVLFQLGRLALGTNQYQKAVERMVRVIELDPNRTEAFCILADAYAGLGEKDRAEEAIKNCKK